MATVALERILRRASSLVALTMFLVLAVAPVPAKAYFSTDAAWTRIVQSMLGFIGEPGTFEINVGRVTNPLRGKVTVEGISIRDAEGEWLTAEHVTLHWNPLRLLRGQFLVHEVELNRPSLLRIPVQKEAVRSSSPVLTGFKLPRLPDRLQIERFVMTDGHLDGAVLGEMAILEASGRLLTEGDRQEVRLDIVRVDRSGDRLSLSYLHEPRARLEVALSVEEEQGGLIARFLGNDLTGPVAIEVEGAGSPEEWFGSLRAGLGGALSGQVDLAASWGDMFSLVSDGHFTLGPDVPEVVRQAGTDIRLKLRAATHADGVIVFEHSELITPLVRLSGQARLSPAMDDIRGTVTAELTSREALKLLIPGLSLDGAEAHLSFDGALDALSFESELNARGADFDGVWADAFQLKASSVSASTDPGADRAVDLKLDVFGVGSVDPTLARLAGETIKATAEARINVAQRQAELITFNAAGDRFEVEGGMAADWSKQVLYGAISAHLPQIEALPFADNLALTGAIEIILSEIQASFQGRFSAEAELRLLDLMVGGAPLAQETGTTFRAGGSIAYDHSVREWEIVNLAAAGVGIALEGALHSSPLAGTAGGEMVMSISELARLSPLVNLPVEGALLLHLVANDVLSDGTVMATLEAQGHDLVFADSEMGHLIGSNPRLKAHVSAGAGFSVEVVQADLFAGELEGRVIIGVNDRRLSGEATVLMPELAVLKNVLGADLGGKGTVDLAVTGTLSAPEIAGFVLVSSLEYEGMEFGTIAGDFIYTASGHMGAEDTLALDLEVVAGPAAPGFVRGTIAFKAENATEFRDMEIEFAGTALRGSVMLHADSLVEGEVDFRIPALGTVSAMLGAPVLSGMVEGVAVFEVRSGTQLALIEAKGLDLAYGESGLGTDPVATASAIDMNARLILHTDRPESKAEIRIQSPKLAGIRFAKADLDLEGALFQPGFMVRIADLDKTEISAGGTADFSEPVWRMTLEDINGSFAGQAVEIDAPLSVTASEGSMVVSAVRMRVGEGLVTGEFAYDRDGYRTDLELVAFPLAVSERFSPHGRIDGTADGRLSLDTRQASASAHLDLRLDNVQLAHGSVATTGFDFVFAGRWDGLRTAVEAHMVTASSPDPLARLELDVPLVPSDQGIPALPEDGELLGRLEIQGPVDVVWDYLPLPDHLLAGTVNLDLSLSGSVRTPLVQGRGVLTGGRYEHIDLGTVVRNLEIAMATDEGQMLDVTLSGNDGAEGTITGYARLDVVRAIRGEADSIADFSARLDNAVIIRRDELTASLSGELTLTERNDRMMLSGALVTDRVEARLVADLPPSVVELPILHVNVSDAAAQADRFVRSSGSPGIDLDVRIEIPGRMFVRGRGLDSEWRGNLHLQGGDPFRLTGEVAVVRGAFDLGGRVFNLTRGNILFDGGEEVNPRLDVEARHTRQDIEATISVSGTLSHPSVELASVPAYPEDEIMSRVLFNKGPHALTPFEAITLANSAATLAGIGGGSDALRRLRDALGVDVLRVTAGEADEGAAVTVGNYAADNVFIGVRQGSGADTSVITIEIELTDNIRLDSDFGATSGGNVGLNWEWRY